MPKFYESRANSHSVLMTVPDKPGLVGKVHNIY